MDRTSRCNNVYAVRLYASYMLNLLLLERQSCVGTTVLKLYHNSGSENILKYLINTLSFSQKFMNRWIAKQDGLLVPHPLQGGQVFLREGHTPLNQAGGTCPPFPPPLLVRLQIVWLPYPIPVLMICYDAEKGVYTIHIGGRVKAKQPWTPCSIS